ncbi:hypothetical protein [Moraxella oblonga]|uniref:hypothetical protein n=1 Tax=Moraxella oblonga TaxID=200413 RepID=UPI000A662449|nr:hypothetical protein [Moraxella oblonga]
MSLKKHQTVKLYKYALLFTKNQVFFVFFAKIFQKSPFVGFYLQKLMIFANSEQPYKVL